MVNRWLTAAAALLVCASASAQDSAGCGIGGTEQRLGSNIGVYLRGLKHMPRDMVRPHNLAWEIPVAVTTIALVEKADVRTADAVTSKSLVHNTGRITNYGIAAELGSGVLAYGVGCAKGNSHLRESAFTALAAAGEAGVSDLVLKLAFDRQFPDLPGKKSKGDFWSGGRSFPSGHSMTSFAFASAIAHRYPDKPFVKWGAYGLATTISVLRVPAKHHFPSDVVVGGALGYVIGAYVADRAPGH